MGDDGLLGRLRMVRVIPVVTIDDVSTAVPTTQALADGGLPVVEITLRTAAGLEALRTAAVGARGATVARARPGDATSELLEDRRREGNDPRRG